MVPKKVRVLDDETGKVVRVGPPRELDAMEKKFFGLFTADTLLKVASIWAAGVIFIIGLDTRLRYLEAERVAMAASIAKMVDFVKASDSWHSAIFQTPFDNGKPLDSSYRAGSEGAVTHH